jgi:hypothetical protein
LGQIATFETKVSILKQHEAYCYQVAFYLLENEPQAVRAAERTLLELFQAADFFQASEDLQRKMAKALAIRNSLSARNGMALV